VVPVQTWTTDEASQSGITVNPRPPIRRCPARVAVVRVQLNRDGSTSTPEAFLSGTLGRLRAIEVGPDGSLWVLNNTSLELKAGNALHTGNSIVRPSHGHSPIGLSHLTDCKRRVKIILDCTV
jgi:hypothetical protein